MNHTANIVAPNERPSIAMRSFQLHYDETLPRYWAANNPWLTHLMNALSCIFPAGERFFVKSVQVYADQISDPQLKREVRHFCGQESIHGQQHVAYNEWMEGFGVSMGWLSDKLAADLNRRTQKYSAIEGLAFTTALEHFTATMGNALLTTPVLQHLHSGVRPLWVWHSLEEIEHKAVAFDVFQAVGGTYWQRVQGMLRGTLGLILSTTALMMILLWRDRQLFNVRAMFGMLRITLGSGYVLNVIKTYFEYFRRDFHPWQNDDRTLFAQYLPEVEAHVRRPKTSQLKRDA